jgi:hypothetical protein
MWISDMLVNRRRILCSYWSLLYKYCSILDQSKNCGVIETAITRQRMCNSQQWSHYWKRYSLCDPCQVTLRVRSLETAVRRVGVWCEMAASLCWRETRSIGTSTSEDTADWENVARLVMSCRVSELAIALQLLVVTSSMFNKSNYPSKLHLQSLHHVTTGVSTEIGLKISLCSYIATLRRWNKYWHVRWPELMS